jgi:hypothetical protein
MTSDEKDFLKQQFKAVHEKLDLTIEPVKSEVIEIKAKVGLHDEKISILELFKEGHQTHHLEQQKSKIDKIQSRRFYWEILVGSGS